MLSLYLHFPFCKSKCSYCDFCSAAAVEGQVSAYCLALEAEIRLAAKRYGDMPVDTVFLGGGTPSVVPAQAMHRVMAALKSAFSILPDAEFTSEANPGTLSDAWLDTLAEAGLNRLSLGVQAYQPRLLTLLGRIHDFSQAREAVVMARKHGVVNLNLDAMFGLPSQTLAEYSETLRSFAALNPTHLSAYSLILEEGTPLAARVARGNLAVPDEDQTADMMETGLRFLETNGFVRYEISNYAKPGYACRHNIGYWQQKHYLGLGLSAASHLPPPSGDASVRYLRTVNTATLATYTQKLAQGEMPVAERVPVRETEAMFETVMLGLRMVAGLRYKDFAALHGQSLPAVYGEAIAQLTTQGLLQPASGDDPRLVLTRKGMALQNTALMAFMASS